MAVFTHVEHPVLSQWLAQNYSLELIAEPEPITDGIENTNYRIVCADSSAYVFTIVEVWSMDIATYCLDLALHMHNKKLAVPQTLQNRKGSTCTIFDDKPAAVVAFASGEPRLQPTPIECATMGAQIASLHQDADDFGGQIPNPRGHAWRKNAARQIAPHLSSNDRILLERAQKADRRVAEAGLPELACHCDLFRNNVLWVNEHINGIIDFYFAGHDLPAFDLAVACIDWCMDDQGTIYHDHLAAMLGAYKRKLPLLPEHPDLLADIFVSAALRFWLSRHLDILNPRAARVLNPHDPQGFRTRLALCLDRPDELLRAMR